MTYSLQEFRLQTPPARHVSSRAPYYRLGRASSQPWWALLLKKSCVPNPAPLPLEAQTHTTFIKPWCGWEAAPVTRNVSYFGFHWATCMNTSVRRKYREELGNDRTVFNNREDLSQLKSLMGLNNIDWDNMISFLFLNVCIPGEKASSLLELCNSLEILSMIQLKFFR